MIEEADGFWKAADRRGEDKVEKEKDGILLESGTNEIEIMKFTIQGEFYGHEA